MSATIRWYYFYRVFGRPNIEHCIFEILILQCTIKVWFREPFVLIKKLVHLRDKTSYDVPFAFKTINIEYIPTNATLKVYLLNLLNKFEIFFIDMTTNIFNKILI